MKLSDIAHIAVEEGYELPLDMMVSMAGQGVIIDEFLNKIEGGYSVESLIDQIEMYGA
jgi:hypothetical protein